MPRSQFAGTWALVATEWRRADGRHANPFGQGAVGILMYDAAGFMSASVMHAERPPLPRDQPSGIDRISFLLLFHAFRSSRRTTVP